MRCVPQHYKMIQVRIFRFDTQTIVILGKIIQCWLLPKQETACFLVDVLQVQVKCHVEAPIHPTASYSNFPLCLPLHPDDGSKSTWPPGTDASAVCVLVSTASKNKNKHVLRHFDHVEVLNFKKVWRQVNYKRVVAWRCHSNLNPGVNRVFGRRLAPCLPASLYQVCGRSGLVFFNGAAWHVCTHVSDCPKQL